MAKQTGLGDNFYVAGYDISGDTQSIGSISAAFDPLDFTAINSNAMERAKGLSQGRMEFTTFWNTATDQEFDALSTLPRTDVVISYFRGTTFGNPAAAMVAKQVNYDTARGTDGSLTHSVQALSSNGVPLEWGVQLTDGPDTHAGEDTGTVLDGGAATSLGAQAYLHVFEFTGTDAVISVQSSSDNGVGDTFADVTGLVSASITSAPYSERLDTAQDASIERYVRVASTDGSTGFTSITFALIFVRNTVALDY